MTTVNESFERLLMDGHPAPMAVQIIVAEQLERIADALDKQNAGITDGIPAEFINTEAMNILGSAYSKIIVETEKDDEPETIAVITDNDVESVKGFQVRLTPR